MEEVMEVGRALARDSIIIGGSVLLGIVAYFVFLRVLKSLSKRMSTVLGESLVKHCRAPLRLIIPVMVIQLGLSLITVAPGVQVFLEQIFSILLIVSIAWLAIKLTYVFEDVLLSQYDIHEKENLKARKVYTQIQILKKVAIVIIGVVALATILMTFDKVRQLGTSILASAGIAGIIVGFAAQKSLATLLAGFQIAMTGPIRIDDVVIVENEWGRIEEITLTYVVVRIWDLRRLILPITYFLENPFQNWTRVSADLLGSVFIYVDYTVPVQAVREELRRILESSKEWDGKVCGLQVTNAKEQTLELRALMSAADSSAAWELRCAVREKLVEFVQKNYPQGLPKVRAEVVESPKGAYLPSGR